MPKPKRKKGWPRAGRLKIQYRVFKKLPEITKLPEVAEILNIRYSTLRRWLVYSEHSFVQRDDNIHWSVYKHELAKWLVETGRLREDWEQA